MTQLTIGQLAATCAVNVETVRYYQRRGLMEVPARVSGAITRYSDDDLHRLRFIKRSQGVGFSLDDVKALLTLDAGQSCAAAREIGEAKLADTRARIRSLQALEGALDGLVSQCVAEKRRVSCPLIRSLMDAEPPKEPSRTR